MTLIVQSERWCEVPLVVSETGACPLCHEAAVIVCQACGTPVCDVHEIVCNRCGRSYCSSCQHACVAGPSLPKAA